MSLRLANTLCLLVILPGAIPLALLAQPAPTAIEHENNAWNLLARYSAKDAGEEFRSAGDKRPSSAADQLGMAAALLGTYPQSNANYDEAEQILQNLVAAETEPQISAASLYLLARIEHLFREDRIPQAEVYYQRLQRDYPNHRLADNAAVKLALIRLNRVSPTAAPEERRTAISQLTEPRHPAARRDFHMVLARFLIDNRDPASALEHLLLVDKLEMSRAQNRADLKVQIGTIAAQLMRYELALRHYEEFLKAYPLDSRNFMVQDVVNQLKARAVQDD